MYLLSIGKVRPSLLKNFKRFGVNIEWTHFKLLTWKVIAHVSSAIGVLVNVNWSGLSSSEVCIKFSE
jgi:hypothetical protein